jgi:hypothetical protein
MSLQINGHATSHRPSPTVLPARRLRPRSCMSHWNPRWPQYQHVVAVAPAATAGDPSKLPRLRATNPASTADLKPGKGQRILIRGGIVVTMAEDNRDFVPGDILVEGDRIVDIDHKIDATDAFVIEARGMIVVPGMVDTHRHTWQSTVHTLGPDWLLSDYFGFMRGVIGRVYRPEDLYIATLLALSRASILAPQRSLTGRI